MIPEITKMVFNLLSDEQIDSLIHTMEEMAKEKLFNVQNFYLSHSKEDQQFAEEFDLILTEANWENFLPNEYYQLKIKKNEQKKINVAC